MSFKFGLWEDDLSKILSIHFLGTPECTSALGKLHCCTSLLCPDGSLFLCVHHAIDAEQGLGEASALGQAITSVHYMLR